MSEQIAAPQAQEKNGMGIAGFVLALIVMIIVLGVAVLGVLGGLFAA